MEFGEDVRITYVMAGMARTKEHVPGMPGSQSSCVLPLARAQAELWQLASQWRARPERVGGFGELWSAG